jgi:hypothetical protein
VNVEHEQAGVAVAGQRVALNERVGDSSDNQPVSGVVGGAVLRQAQSPSKQ